MNGPLVPFVYGAFQWFTLAGPTHPSLDRPYGTFNVAERNPTAEAVSLGGGWILDTGFRTFSGLYLGIDGGVALGRRDDDSFYVGPRYGLTGGGRIGSAMLEMHLGGVTNEAGWISFAFGLRNAIS